MKRNTTIIAIALMVVWSKAGFAQIDNAKMDRDLRVASSVLGSLMNNDSDNLFRGGEPEGNYVEGYGVIFTLEDNMIFRYNYKVNWDAAREATRAAEKAMRAVEVKQREVERAQRDMERAQREAENEKEVEIENNKDKDKSKKYTVEIAPVPKVAPVPKIDEEEMRGYQEKYEKANEEFSKNIKEAVKTFLVDYSQLIGQLKPTDKILVTTKSNEGFVFYLGNDDGENVEKSRLSAEMLVKDHKDFEAGKLTRDNLINKIKFVENAKLERKPDLDLFGNMLKTTYNQNYTETYFISSTPRYELLSGLGVVYNARVYSSYSDNGLYRVPGVNKSSLSQEERDKAVQDMYPKFVDGFKENIIRYGSTIKSIESGNKLIVKVRMTECSSCTFPKSIEFMVDKAVLDGFSKGSLTLEQAKNKVTLKD